MTKIRAVLRRRWPVIVAATLLGALAGAASTVVAPADTQVTYRATQVVVANQSTGGAPTGNVEQDALKVTRGAVAQQAADTLGEPDLAKELAAEIQSVPTLESQSIEISSESTDSQLAARRVDAFVQAFLDVTNGDLLKDQEAKAAELERSVATAQAALTAFDTQNPGIATGAVQGAEVLVAQRQQLNEAVVNAQDQLTDFRVNQQSSLPYSSLGAEAPSVVDNQLLPVPSSPVFRIGLLGLVGLALGLGLVMVLERISPRIDTRDELVDVLDIPILAEVGAVSPKKVPRTADGRLSLVGSWAEPYRRIRSAVQFLQANPHYGGAAGGDEPTVPRVFLITSASPGEGKSTTAALTGLALAEAGNNTLVVGGDFRRPSVERLLGAPSEPGIRDLARLDINRPTHAEVVLPSGVPHLWVTPSGPATKEVVGMADAARELIGAASAQGGTVLVDSCPVEAANDAIDLLPAVDEVILVVRSGRTARSTLLNTLELLRMHGGHLMGAVLIGTPGVGRMQSYFEDYYAPSAPAELDAPAPAAQPVGAPVGNGAPSRNGASVPSPAAAPTPQSRPSGNPPEYHPAPTPPPAAATGPPTPPPAPPPAPPSGPAPRPQSTSAFTTDRRA